MKQLFLIFNISLIFLSALTFASETKIEKVKVEKKSSGKYSFSVTLLHGDKSWDHYANVWQVETLDGKVLAKRVLQHPHITEQPFTRSLSSVSIPKGVTKVVVVAGCTVDGLNSEKITVEL